MKPLKLIKYVIVDKHGKPIFETINDKKMSCINEFVDGYSKFITWLELKKRFGYSCQKVEILISECTEKSDY